MRTTIDKAGRVVIPKELRAAIGLVTGDVDLSVDGSSIKITPVAGDELSVSDGLLVIPRSGTAVDDDVVRALRDADQR
ncbi:MAG: AbrB/MazE/SpoVT family DNA-binding domain-containing protein [Geodermatophilaceae bacterium]|nr:AbrB/MazE/SpoVT family DNA-binding domain-containing protein [Geodermatophilaceae bacterium]